MLVLILQTDLTSILVDDHQLAVVDLTCRHALLGWHVRSVPREEVVVQLPVDAHHSGRLRHALFLHPLVARCFKCDGFRLIRCEHLIVSSWN